MEERGEVVAVARGGRDGVVLVEGEGEEGEGRRRGGKKRRRREKAEGE